MRLWLKMLLTLRWPTANADLWPMPTYRDMLFVK